MATLARVGIVALALSIAGLAMAPGGSASPSQTGAYVLDDVWPVEDGDAEPLAVAVRTSGVSYTVNGPLRAASGFATLVRREPDGTVSGRYVLRGGDPQAELRPIAVDVTPGGDLFVATDRLLVSLEPTGAERWHAPAGDGHPEFGPAARGLASDGVNMYGTDLANGRIVGYDGSNGAMRLRLGTVGSSPGAYRSPMDVAVGPSGALHVADFGNQRIQVLDTVGNPMHRWPLPARPVAVDVDATGRTFALMNSEQVLVLDASGIPLTRFGAPGRGPGELQMASDLAVARDGRVLVVDRGNRRIVVFRPVTGPVPTATGGSEGPSTATPPPDRTRLAACPGQPASLDMRVEVGPRPPLADVVLLVDTTGSMEAVVSTAQSRTLDLAAGLASAADDVAVGLVDVRDYPYGEAGHPTDWPWFLRGPLSTDPADLAAAVAQLRASGGGDAPEAYSGAIVGALDHPRAGWRDGARRILVLLGDSVPRDDDLNEGVDEPRVPGVWAPGRPRNWRDSGPDWAPRTSDDLDWSAVLARLEAQDVTLLVGASGAAPDALAGQVGLLIEYWRKWLALAGPGGDAVDLHEPADLPETLEALVSATVRHIELLEARAEPPARAGWVTFEPQGYADIDVPPTGLVRAFGVAIEPPPGVPDGSYDLRVEAWGDGAMYARELVTVDWRESCEPTPTPDEPVPSETASPSVTRTPSATTTATMQSTPTATRRPTHTGPSVAYLPLAARRYCPPGARPKADIALVLDTSSSMAGGAKLEAAVQAAAAFVGLLDMPRDHAAVVEFDGTARVAAGLTGSRAALLVALAEASTSAGTRIDLGLAAALAEMSGPRARGDATPVVVLLTDGRPDDGTEVLVRTAAERARDAGVTVFTIGLGADVDGELLGDVATDPSRYYFAPSAPDLEAIYDRIAAGIPCQ